MPLATQNKILNKFGRYLSLLFNRAMMYNIDHPHTASSFADFHKTLAQILSQKPTISLIINRDQCLVDEEALDPKINLSRLISHFNQADIQSITFEDGYKETELRLLFRVITDTKKYPRANHMKIALKSNQVTHIKINHVVFKKVTMDEEIVSKDMVASPLTELEEHQIKDRQHFLEMMLKSVLNEEVEKTLSIQNILANPAQLSKVMFDAELSSFESHSSQLDQPGKVLYFQLEKLENQIDDIAAKSDIDPYLLADSLTQFKNQLIEHIQIKKDEGVTFPNESEIRNKAFEISDKAIINLIVEEYGKGKISVVRLVQIICRLIPDKNELKRLFPRIKTALLDQDMPVEDFNQLALALENELKSDDITKALEQSAEKLGLETRDLIKELEQNPLEAAELIYLAAEIRKETGDDKILSDLLVDYVELMGTHISKDVVKKSPQKDDNHLRSVISSIESEIVAHLKQKDIPVTVIEEVENRLNKHLDTLLIKFKSQTFSALEKSVPKSKDIPSTLLQMLEEKIDKDEPFYDVIQKVRNVFHQKGLDENNFHEIYTHIQRKHKDEQKKLEERIFLKGVLKPQIAHFLIDKELSRSRRYGTTFSILAFSIVRAKPQKKVSPQSIQRSHLIVAILERLAQTVRTSDMVGVLGKNKIIAILPMISGLERKKALNRNLKALHDHPFMVHNIPVDVKLAGIAVEITEEESFDLKDLLDHISNELFNMVVRVKNVQDFV